MATVGDERQLLKKGLEQDGMVRGVWAQNMWLARGAVSVRPGWGVRSELDTTLINTSSYNSSTASDNSHISLSESNYREHLGSALVESNFGNTQIVSVFRGKLNPGNLGLDPRNETVENLFCVRIFDLTTGRTWEEPLCRTTSEMAGGKTKVTSTSLASHPSEWYGTYETSFEVDHTGFVSSDFESEWFFHVSRGFVYFGCPSVGVFLYRPTDFGKIRLAQTATASRFDWLKGHSESGLVLKIHFTEGVFADGFIYADQSNISKIVAATSFRGRMAYATDYEIWFSDVGRPNNVVAKNFIAVPSSEKVTAMQEFKGNLIIFTRSETFVYVPSEGFIVSQGRPPLKVSESVGCIGPQAITMIEDDLAWVSYSGVFSTPDGRTLRELSEPIRAFWGNHGLMTNPMTSYYEANAGFADINGVNPPRTLLSFDPKRVTLAYNHDKRALIMGSPNINGCWSFTGLWSWWPMESSVSKDGAGNPIVACQQNLTNPWVLATNDSIYCVAGMDTSIVSDATETVISNADLTYPVAPITSKALPTTANSYVVCQLGYGGALDRSSYKEDHRNVSGHYLPVLRPDPAFDSGVFYFDEPYIEKDTTTGVEKYWVPVSLVPPSNTLLGGNPINSYELFFQFDNTEWNAEPNASGNIALRISTERLTSHTAPNALVANTTDAAGAASNTGDHIHIKFDGTTATIPASSWTYQPNLNITEKRKNPLFEIGFLKSTASSVNGFFIWPKSVAGPINVNVKSSTHTVNPVGMLVWAKHFIGTADSHNDNAKVQAVDWAYKSDEESNGPLQIKARGIYAKMNSRGRGLQANRVVPNWVWGLYNVVLGSDSKEYTSQIVDYDDNIQKIENKTTIRSRFRTVACAAMSKRTFSSGPTWGNRTTPADGNYLIDDQQTDDIATSDSVKGQRISYMVFGFIQDRAESLSLQSLLGVFRLGGRRRRTGR